MNKIKNSTELRNEILRLESLSQSQKEGLKKEIFDLKENFRPGNILKSLISDLTGIKVDSESFLKDGFSYTLSLLLQQFLLKTERKFEKSIYTIVDSLIDKIRNLINSFSNPEAKKRERAENL